MAVVVAPQREQLVRRGRWLAFATIGWNSIEGIAAIASGLAAGSVALIGFGVDSYVEVFAGLVILWRLHRDRLGAELSAAAERRAVRLIAVTFIVLGVGVGLESVRRLIIAEHPDESVFGVVLRLFRSW